VHNGKVIHENVELNGPTRGPMAEDEKPTGPSALQGDHGPVAYRNLWVKPGLAVTNMNLSRGKCLAVRPKPPPGW